MKQKLNEWVRRYLPPFLIATLATLLFSNLGRLLELNNIIIAYMGSLGGIVSYYLYLSLSEKYFKNIEKVTLI